MARILYKYLDINGGKMMLGNSNLQFTNATQLNDPFDCHPNLIAYVNTPDALRRDIPEDKYIIIEKLGALNLRHKSWLCSLSKINDSLLMWSHYCRNHSGICVGLNIDKVNEGIPPMGVGCAFRNPIELEVDYRDILTRPKDADPEDFLLNYQLRTKAKDWAYEQEVRLVILNPRPELAMLSHEQAIGNNLQDLKEVRHYLPLSGKCFESIYLGINIDPNEKEKICSYVREKLNPDIKIYQMRIDEDAFRLKAEQIN